MDCRIAIPGVDDALRTAGTQGSVAGRWPATAWCLARATRRVADSDVSWRDWLLQDVPAATTLLRRHAAGPCRKLEYERLHDALPGGEPAVLPQGTSFASWACVDAVQLAATLDSLCLGRALVPRLGDAEAAALVAALDAQLAPRGWQLMRVDSMRWLAACRDAVDCATTEPADARGRDLRDLMPQGRDGRRVRSIMNELQMLLHEHPVNVSRRESGADVANAVWIWGFGSSSSVDAASLPPLVSDDEWLRNLWLAHDSVVESNVVAAFERWQAGATPPTLVALVASAEATQSGALLDELERCLFVPLRSVLRRFPAARVDCHDGASVWRISGLDRWAFWRRPRLSTAGRP